MKRSLRTIVAICALAIVCSPPGRASADTKQNCCLILVRKPYGAIVPAGIGVPVELVSEIDSATFGAGDSFAFKTLRAVRLGELLVPKGTPGHGRIATVRIATTTRNGALALQADSIDLPDGVTIWVDIDPRAPVTGQFADKHTHFRYVAIATDYSGNLVLQPGTPFEVTTIARRSGTATLSSAL